MPLPDATPDKRIYELLKTVDLENLTFADLQAVGQTIYAEQGAEDELRRLVLLNLARLSVIGEWTGLTSAGGASGSIAQLLNLNGWEPQAAGYEPTGRNPQQVYAGSTDTSQTVSTYGTYYYYFPITIRGDGNYDGFSFMCTTFASASSLEGGFYNSDAYGRPQTRLATFNHTFTGTGADAVTVTEDTAGSMTLSDGDNIWFCVKHPGGNSASIRTWAISGTNCQGFSLVTGSSNGSPFNCLTSLNLPTTFTESDLTAFGEKNIPIIYW
jgi:hypothetical protein